jgi:lipopolysaccharide transport system ATP-binding protein
MSDIAIRVEGLGKQYRIGGKQEGYKTLRDLLASAASRPFRIARSLFGGKARQNGGHETIWALKDVSFEVKRGEVVGIIGRNGAGKSTLLKILSRITEPTEGFAENHGRVGSLLEVGTGFHPELTGRENIYLNGAILGMRRKEIDRKFDQIVAFAEIEQFIDTAVKHYSSGMYMRLAFAVAAHLEPEILLVDEVLAVGDAAFQKKCLGKIGEVAHEGRTVLFVSHNLGHIRRLCTKAVCFDHGHPTGMGAVDPVILEYQKHLAGRNDELETTQQRRDSGILGWRLADADSSHEITDSEKPFTTEFTLRLARRITHSHITVVLRSGDGVNVAGWGLDGVSANRGIYTIRCRLSCLPLRPGAYSWYVAVWEGSTAVDVTELVPELEVCTPPHSTLPLPWAGFLNIPCEISVVENM